MNPVVPGVRAGDVLTGTRMLRRWLQTSVRYLALREGTDPNFYSPDKDTKFVVAVNAGKVFIVWAERPGMGKGASNKLMLIPFVNVSKPTAALGHKQDQEYYKERMSPSLFSRWFIKTVEKRTALQSWPSGAYACWVLYHMNGDIAYPWDMGLSTGYDEHRVWYPRPVFFPTTEAPNGSTLEQALASALHRGLIRRKDQTGGRLLANISTSCGPTEDNLRLMEVRIAEEAAEKPAHVSNPFPKNLSKAMYYTIGGKVLINE